VTPKTYVRFSLGQRIQHAVLIVSFTALAVTGLPQKYAATRVGERAIALLGGIEWARVLHRVAAIVLMAATIVHLLDVAYRVYVRRRPLSMLPRWPDVLHFAQTLRYNFGLAPGRPRMGRFTFEEKLEYWALIWGTVIMIVTGFMLWNPIATTDVLPGQWIPAALVAHGGEAVLAVLAVIVWHGYGVHLRHFNRSMFTGTMSEDEMRHEHPLELEEIEAGRHAAGEDAAAVARRRRLFLPVAAAFSVALLAGLYWFVTFEKTALDTVPRPRAAAPSYSK
jgi:cytochrome b subunit of formate dehydrogenase